MVKRKPEILRSLIVKRNQNTKVQNMNPEITQEPVVNPIGWEDDMKPGQQKRRERRASNKKRVKNKPLNGKVDLLGMGGNHLIHIATKGKI